MYVNSRKNKLYLCEKVNVDCISKNIAIIMFTIRFNRVKSIVLNINKTQKSQKRLHNDWGLNVSSFISTEHKWICNLKRIYIIFRNCFHPIKYAL